VVVGGDFLGWTLQRRLGGARHFMQTARTCLKSVTPWTTFWIPS
jgi:hypothetical protein